MLQKLHYLMITNVQREGMPGRLIRRKILNVIMLVKISLPVKGRLLKQILIGEKIMSLMVGRDIVEICFLLNLIVSELATFIIMGYITG